MTWGAKGIGGKALLVLRTFYRQRVLVTLLCAHVVSILKDAITISEGSSSLKIILFYMFFMTCRVRKLHVPLVVHLFR
jgi:hypothetical protein